MGLKYVIVVFSCYTHFFVYLDLKFIRIYLKPLIYNDITEPPHEISNNVVCATSKGLDQPAHMNILLVLSF